MGRKGNREVGKNGTESPVLSACHAPGTGWTPNLLKIAATSSHEGPSIVFTYK